MSKKSIGFERIESLSNNLFDLSQYLFSNPELAYKETKAHDYLCKLFESFNFKVNRNFVHHTGFRATFETAAKPHFAIVVEYDALPNIGHACGHNLIAESSVAAALGFQSIMINGQFCKLSVFGTPAEEGGGGKIKFITDGIFDDVDLCIMSHPFKLNILNLDCLALIGLTITFKGKESHASLAPWEGKNALDAAVLAYQSISCLRQQISPKSRVHGIISHGGDAPNIIPKLTEMKYYIRHPNKTGLLELIPRICACFESAATMAQCEVQIIESCPMYEHLNNNKVLMDIFYKNASELGIKFSDYSPDLSGSSDIGNVSHACPTIQPMFYIGTNAENHTVEFADCAATEQAHIFSLNQGKAMMATLADVLFDETGNILYEIKECFKVESLEIKSLS